MLPGLMTAAGGWDEFKHHSEAELWQAIAALVGQVAEQPSGKGVVPLRRVGGMADSDVEGLETRANMAICWALARRFPDTVSVEVADEDADAPRIRISVELIGQREPWASGPPKRRRPLTTTAHDVHRRSPSADHVATIEANAAWWRRCAEREEQERDRLFASAAKYRGLAQRLRNRNDQESAAMVAQFARDDAKEAREMSRTAKDTRKIADREMAELQRLLSS
jgi:hypothetical protein